MYETKLHHLVYRLITDSKLIDSPKRTSYEIEILKRRIKKTKEEILNHNKTRSLPFNNDENTIFNYLIGEYEYLRDYDI